MPSAQRCEEAARTFVQLLLAGDKPLSDVAEAAEELDLPDAERFCVAVVAAPRVQLDTKTPNICVTVEGSTVLVVPDVDTETVAQLVHAAVPNAVAGIGASRLGVDGAMKSAVDARQALVVGKVLRRTVRWEECWWLAVLTDHVEQLRDVVEPTWTVARTNAHLAEAVEAFAKESFSSTRAASRLFVHPNTVIYRLRQWQRTTGSNPHSLTGLTSSICALTLGPLTDEAEPQAPKASAG